MSLCFHGLSHGNSLLFTLFHRKLTSSQITISTKSDPYKKNETAAYALPGEEAQTTHDIYNTQEGAGDLYDDLENVRKQTLAIAEDNIYGGSQNALYSARDLYSTREQHAGYHEEPFNPVEGSNPQDPLYQDGITNTELDNIYIYQHLSG